MTSTFNKILTALFLMSYVLVLISFQSDTHERTKVKNQELSQELQEVKGEAKELQQKINNEIAKNVKLEFKWGNMIPDHTPQISVSPCTGNIPLMESATYTIGYKFFEQPKKFKVVFSDSVSDLEIDLLEQIISENPDPIIGVNAEIPISGYTSVKAYAEGHPGKNMMLSLIHI